MRTFRAAAFLFAFALVLAAGNLLFTAREVNTVRDAVRAQCGFDYDLAGVPVAVNPATHKASVLGVKIVADSRLAWRGLGCTGTLPPPSPSFRRWAAYYHVPSS